MREVKPGNESLPFSWFAQPVAMAPKAKTGPWFFRWEGVGFSELHLILLLRSGPIHKPVSSLFTSGEKSEELIWLRVGSEWAGESILAVGHLWCISCSPNFFELHLKTEDNVSRRNRGKIYSQSHRGGEWPCLQAVATDRGVSGTYVGISETVTQVSSYSQRRKTKRIICSTYLRSLVQSEVCCTGWSIQVGQMSPSGGWRKIGFLLPQSHYICLVCCEWLKH